MMPRIYANLCENTRVRKNFNTVPDNIKEETRAMIEGDGYVINPDGTVTKATEE